ncbi:YqhV family protein [Alkalicoccobacillus plakortidis]|uniref:YqhV family protein n=1 Tax=Alkalicoccobacillus plakortidis TaxID=444060 RepID=A0ABT0XIF8_9BACI|nr:YqhV family protein [Alkalicoccobacillus plakortidis]MCM2674984.1 YqhV family protein [Alkalicoccobacillus plakortidis]
MKWFVAVEWTLLIMVFLRVLSGLIELTVAGLILRFNSIEKAIVLNGLLAVIGPTIFILSIVIGLVGITDKLSVPKFMFIGTGAVCILIGARL